jgi:hypothetical protein
MRLLPTPGSLKHRLRQALPPSWAERNFQAMKKRQHGTGVRSGQTRRLPAQVLPAQVLLVWVSRPLFHLDQMTRGTAWVRIMPVLCADCVARAMWCSTSTSFAAVVYLSAPIGKLLLTLYCCLLTQGLLR